MRPHIAGVVALYIAAITGKDNVYHVNVAVAVQVVVIEVHKTVYLLHDSLKYGDNTRFPSGADIALCILGSRIETRIVDLYRPYHIKDRVKDTHRVGPKVVADTSFDIIGIDRLCIVCVVLLAGQLLVKVHGLVDIKRPVVPIHQHHQTLEF